MSHQSVTQNGLNTGLGVLRKRPGLTVIDIIGLGLGIAAGVVIVPSARPELTYDPFRENQHRTFKVYKDRDTRTGTRPVGPATKNREERAHLCVGAQPLCGCAQSCPDVA